MTLEEFQKGGKRIVDECNIILIHEHKTKAKFGTAQVSVSKDLYDLMKSYVKFYSPSSEETCLFLTWCKYDIYFLYLCYFFHDISIMFIFHHHVNILVITH